MSQILTDMLREAREAKHTAELAVITQNLKEMQDFITETAEFNREYVESHMTSFETAVRKYGEFPVDAITTALNRSRDAGVNEVRAVSTKPRTTEYCMSPVFLNRPPNERPFNGATSYAPFRTREKHETSDNPLCITGSLHVAVNQGSCARIRAAVGPTLQEMKNVRPYVYARGVQYDVLNVWQGFTSHYDSEEHFATSEYVRECTWEAIESIL